MGQFIQSPIHSTTSNVVRVIVAEQLNDTAPNGLWYQRGDPGYPYCFGSESASVASRVRQGDSMAGLILTSSLAHIELKQANNKSARD
jgi:hypothetical protein